MFLPAISVVALTSLLSPLQGADWSRFRGSNGAGTATTAALPVTWSDTSNIRWKRELPGPGSSSPIVVGKHVFVTCYTGYGTDQEKPGRADDLKRHLICFERGSGQTVWSQSIDGVLPEDDFKGFIVQHGYASHTPVSDGERVYAFLGKSGVIAFDLDGNRLWRTTVGTESGSHGWGSGASPILHENLVIVNASEESQSLYALNKRTGSQVWRAQAAGLANSWSTPVLADAPDGSKELVVAVPDEVWGLNPDTGKLLWRVTAGIGSFVCPSVVTQGGIVYAMGGRGRGDGALVAIRTGGRGDVTDSHTIWASKEYSPVPTPLLYDGRIYCLNDSGIVICVDASDGSLIYKERLLGGGAGGNRSTYASMVVAGGKIYAVSRFNGTYVIAVGDEYKQLAVNVMEDDDSDFHGTPAISDDQMFLRSNRYLYCVEAE